jgi:hypothetical protein
MSADRSTEAAPSTSEVVAINLIPVRHGVAAEEFATFSSTVDQPLCIAQDVVLGFDAYRVVHDAGLERPFDIVEVMRVRSWSEWERVRDGLAELRPVTERFDELVNSSLVRTFLATRIARSERS